MEEEIKFHFFKKIFFALVPNSLTVNTNFFNFQSLKFLNFQNFTSDF